MYIDQKLGGDRATSDELSHQDIILRARIAANKVLKANYLDKLGDGDRSNIQMCIASYELSLQNDADCAFVTLPDFFISLAHNRGIDRIFQRKTKNKGNPSEVEFALVHQPAVNLKTRVASYPGINICWQEGFKLKFYNMYVEPNQQAKMIVNLVVAAPDSIGENDPLPITSDMVDLILKELTVVPLQNPPVPNTFDR
jgi:hypothetical protein